MAGGFSRLGTLPENSLTQRMNSLSFSSDLNSHIPGFHFHLSPLAVFRYSETPTYFNRLENILNIELSGYNKYNSSLAKIPSMGNMTKHIIMGWGPQHHKDVRFLLTVLAEQLC